MTLHFIPVSRNYILNFSSAPGIVIFDILGKENSMRYPPVYKQSI